MEEAKGKGESTEVAEAPVPAEVKVVMRMTISMMSDGNCSVDGPLSDRSAILCMLQNAHDLSYEYEKQEKARAAAASAPPPKRFSKAWWAEQFRLKAEARRAREAAAGAAPAPGTAADDDVSARLMAAKTEGLSANDGAGQGPDGGTPGGKVLTH